ncbi:MAG: exonuclease domain-containing protein [Nodosilinea sp.]
MDPIEPVPVPAAKPARQPRKCGVCGFVGHDKRNCPTLKTGTTRNVAQTNNPTPPTLEQPTSKPRVVVTALKNPDMIDWHRVFYVIFDVETTGRSRDKWEIIEIAGVVCNKDGIPLEDAHFVEFVKPVLRIPAIITQLTTISNEDVKEALNFGEVGAAFIRFMKKYADENPHIDHVILVAHNGKAFDLHILLKQLWQYGILDDLFGDKRFGLSLDTLIIARAVTKKKLMPVVPEAHDLKTLFQFVTQQPPATAHRAMADVSSTGTVFRYDHYWKNRKQFLFEFIPGPALTDKDPQQSNVGDVEDDSDDGIASVRDAIEALESSSDEEEEEVGASDDTWARDLVFNDPVPSTTERFNNRMTTTTRQGGVWRKPGLQCHPVDVNTILKSWRTMFTPHILNRIVKYTNEYGSIYAKDWVDITQKDLEAFIAVLFISGIQKRKDKPTHWFSNDRMLENPIMKQVISGRKFFLILRYLHCCPSVYHDTASSTYDPTYKIAELRDYLESRYQTLFEPGQELSLDETLIRAFGRMKFKVRIVTKAARYGIKVYVVTDARTAFVLKVIFYTGKSTYRPNPDAVEKKKTVQVVQQLVEAYRGTHRTVYVDRFYTSIDLIKELSEMDLYVTGTVMQNRIPADIRIAKKSAENRAMERGDCVKGKVTYKKQDGSMAEVGLVCWKDRQVVYCLSNDTNNEEMDQCRRRAEGGCIDLPRPKAIAKYNQFMGGVDLADMKRLHCSSTIMGQNRWWLKLFFYLLDVGTSNANILYNEALRILHGNDRNSVNIVDYKIRLVEYLVGKDINELLEGKSKEENDEHKPIELPQGRRERCVVCTMESGGRTRTRFRCQVCGVALCVPGHGKHINNCFAEAHSSLDVLKKVLKKAEAMKRNDSSQK